MKYLFVLLLVSVFIAPVAWAQLLVAPSKPLSLEITPAFPEPHSNMTVRVAGSAITLENADIEWYIDDILAPELGTTPETTVTAPTIGASLSITAVVTEGERTEEVTRVVRPALVTLAWDTDTYVPPTYRGRRLPSSQSQIRVEAYPHVTDTDGELLARNTLTYTWKRNGAKISGTSGKGRTTITVPAPRLFSTDAISVEVSTAGTIVAEEQVRISTVDPFTRLYYEHPLFGTLFHRELGTYPTIYDSEARVTAVPFFANVTRPNAGSLLYEWRVNGISIEPDPETPQQLTLDAGGERGQGNIQLELSDTEDYFLSARNAWSVLLSPERVDLMNRPRFQ